MKTIKIDTLLLEPITYNLINSNLIDTLCCKFCSILFFFGEQKRRFEILHKFYQFCMDSWTMWMQRPPEVYNERYLLKRFFTCVIGIDKVTNFTKRVTLDHHYPWFFNGFLKLKKIIIINSRKNRTINHIKDLKSFFFWKTMSTLFS